MTRRLTVAAQARALFLAIVFSVSTFGLAALPVELPIPLPLPEPEAAQAGFCASGPNFTGRLTADTASTTAISRVTSASVAPYISNVATAWSCTAFFRYSGLTWNTTATTGTFNWGLLANDAAGCNWVVGSTDYLKNNATTDCPDSDAEYAMTASLTSQGVYQRDVAHNSTGDFSYVHADCGTDYGAEPVKTGQTYDTGITGNRPGANCDPIALDDTATAQTVTYDSTNPTVAVTSPASGGPHERDYTTYQVVFNPSDNVAGFGGAYLWSLQRQIATIPAHSTCGTFANDGAAGNLVTGTAQGSQTAASQTLANGKCYRWVLTAEDQNGNGPVSLTSGSMLIDQNGSTVDFTNPNDGTTITQSSTSFAPTWTATDAYSGVASTSLQRQRVADTALPCPTSGYTNDGSASSSPSGTSYTLTTGYCYQWVLTVTDGATNATVLTSGKLFVDASSPSTNFSTPNEGTLTIQNTTSFSVAWSEAAGSGSITSRSLQRQRGTSVNQNSCLGVSWANDGSPTTSTSPYNSTAMLNGYCYRWVQTLTNSAGKSSATTSGSVLVDTSAPTGSLVGPDANRPVAGDVDITGSATDADTFKEYQLEYGAGSAPSSWTSIGTFTSEVPGTGTLATWSAGTLNGAYTIRLTVRDNANNTASVTTRLVYLENGERGTESYFTRIPSDLGGGYMLDVGVSNGEARLARDLFEIPSYGPAQSLSLTYSSLEATKAGRFGYGWHSNLTQYLTFESGFVVWHRADGGRVPFGNVSGTWTSLAGHFQTLTRGGSEDTITLKDQNKYVFENTGSGRLKRIENRFGKTLTLVWNASSATATDASGRVTTIAIDSVNDRITGVTDSAGRVWGFGYNAGHDLTSITDPASKVTTLGYDASHRLTTVVRSRSRVVGSPETITWSVGYTSGKATTVTDPEDAAGGSYDHVFAYNAGSTLVDRLTSYAANDHARTTYTLEPKNRGWVAASEVAGLTTTYTRDDAGNVTSEVRPAADGGTAATVRTFDAKGNLLTETNDIDNSTVVTTAYSYNATNDLLTMSEADNDAAVKLVTRSVYDGSGRLTSTNVNCTTSGTTPPTDASTCTGAGTQNASTNLITTFAYTANHQLDAETDPLGRVTKHEYDSHGNQTKSTQNYVSGQSATADRNVLNQWAFDQLITAGKAGLPTSTTDPLGNVTTMTYDTLGRRLTEVLPGDTSIPSLTNTTTYDELGNVLTETASWTPLGAGSAVSRTTTHVYDKANHDELTTDPAGVQTTNAYDPAGNAISTDAGGVTTTRAYDDRNLLDTETVEDGAGIGDGVTDVNPDPAGNAATVNEATGVETTTEFTDTGLVSEVQVTGQTNPTTHAYDKLARELTTTSPEGVVTTRVYDRVGRLLSETVDGKTTTHVYDRAGNELTVTDPEGIVTTTAYDALNRHTSVIVNDVASPSLPSDDIATGTWYDAAGNTIAVRDPAGTTARIIVNVRGMAKQTIANCTDSGTTPTSNPPACTGAGTHSSTTNLVGLQTYDGSGAVVNSTSADGTSAEATTEVAYDGAGRVIATKDPRGTISRTFFDVDGRTTTTVVNCTTSGTTIPSDWATCTGAGTQDGTFNLTTTYTYDGHGNQASMVAPNGRVTTSTYDDGDRLTVLVENDVASPAGPADDVTTELFYDEGGRQAAVRTADAADTTTVTNRSIYDEDGRVVKEIQNCTDTGTTPPESPALCTGLGTVDATTNVVTEFVYDDRGNRIKTIAPDPSATAGGSTATVVTRHAFDDDNRLCRVVESSTQTDPQWDGLADQCSTAITGTTTTNVSTRYTYDGAGNLASMVDGRGSTTSYGYDAAGRPTSRTDASGETINWLYDDVGNKVTEQNRTDPPFTSSVTWTYDAAGRILTRTANGTTTTYTYDANGNKLTASDGSLTITATYDRLNRPLTVDDEDAGSTADTTYSYSLTSPSWTDPTGTYQVTLDKFDRTTIVNDPVNASNFTWTYGANGQPLTFGQPNGNTTTFAYDDLGRLTSKDAESGGGTDRAMYDWTHNRAGQILTEASTVSGDSTNGTTTYTYDPLARLSGYTRSGTTTTYGWDKVPNRTSVQVGAGTTVTTTFDAANRPTSDTLGGAYISDDDGRLTDRPDGTGAAFQRFEWDNLSRLTKVKPPTGGSTIATYSYDPLDRLRLVDYGGSNRIRFRYVGLSTSVAQVIDDQSGTVIRHVGTGWDGLKLLDWTGTGSNIRIYGTNAHHDATWTGSSTGSVSAALRYDPWGNLAASTGSSLPDFRFQSSWFDTTTELSWVVTRWYAPAQGRFISEDSLLGDPARPASRHLFAYGEAEPVAHIDPTGQWACVIPVIGWSICGAIVQVAVAVIVNAPRLVTFLSATGITVIKFGTHARMTINTLGHVVGQHSQIITNAQLLARDGVRLAQGGLEPVTRFLSNSQIIPTIRQTLTSPTAGRLWTRSDGTQFWEYAKRFSNPVGIDAYGNPQYWLRVIVRVSDRTITSAYPTSRAFRPQP
jgi:RHS repeat-associated protein